jgi:TonB-dependent SusC/RagA subfamily outer membrane receptor
MVDEVIVVAFGTTKKSAFTGSATVLNTEELSKKTAANVANALVGSVPGMQMTGMSGAPGADNGAMYIRGLTSLESSLDPLIIVDGAPYYASLTNISTDDIESVTVLKDAASAALYGAAGAAGVILITTKKGNTEEAVVNVDMKWGANTRAIQDYDRITDPAEYYEAYYTMMNNYYRNQRQDAVAANANANSLDAKELALIQRLCEYPSVVRTAGDEFSPAVICNYAYALACDFNSFYHDLSILNEPDEQKKTLRLLLSANVAKILNSAFGLLGIEMPERM